jgi:hypothetical protein
MPANGLAIIEPADRATIHEQFVVVRGLARPGSVITRDIPLWFDDHTTADSAGLWSFALSLNEGNNTMTFRVGNDLSTAQTLTVIYRQR